MRGEGTGERERVLGGNVIGVRAEVCRAKRHRAVAEGDGEGGAGGADSIARPAGLEERPKPTRSCAARETGRALEMREASCWTSGSHVSEFAPKPWFK